MHNRIDNCFATLRAEKKKAFIPYICAGDPSFEKTVGLALALEKAGADLIELGVPFSDPLADGIVNQLAAQRALEAGATVQGVLECVREIRRRSQISIVLYTYMNPIYQFGFDKFHREAEAAGVDALLILDLPPDEEMKRENETLYHIRLVAPTTPNNRLKNICAQARGFIYYVSREGVTGARSDIASSLADRLAQIRGATSLPIAVGFGISNVDQAREVARLADAVVIGSAIVREIAEHAQNPELPRLIVDLVAPLIAEVKSVSSVI
ncbi:MAG: tryptophan synthase alpha chain [Verrucomicrobiota bacterium]|jgi:tryptophan synthase alpha chain